MAADTILGFLPVGNLLLAVGKPAQTFLKHSAVPCGRFQAATRSIDQGIPKRLHKLQLFRNRHVGDFDGSHDLCPLLSSAHRIHNPITPDKLATLGAALRLKSGARVLDLGSGSGEMLCTWARDHGVVGTGIDMSQLFSEQAKRRAVELGVADRVEFIHGDAAGHVSDEKVDVAACVGATWIGGGVAGTIELLARSLRTGGIIIVGEPFWRQLPPTEEVAKGCLAHAITDFLLLPELLASFGRLGYDVVEMVLADQDGWDRYEAAKWLTMRRWLAANPDDELAGEVRAQLTSEPVRYAAYTREYVGWGVFALMPR